MKKLINGMLYGSSKTKIFLWSMAILIIGGLSLVMASVLTSNFGLFIAALLLGVAALILSQTNTLRDSHTFSKNSINNKIDLSALDNVPDNQIYNHIDEHLIEQILIAYKVKKDHRMVLIDRSDKFKISQCPAYIWVEKSTFNILLIEKEPRRITIPLSAITNITYDSRIPVYVDSEYLQFKKQSLIKTVFYQYLPDYYGNQQKYKNLYFICNDIGFTNNSIKQVMDLIYAEFKVEDDITKKNNNQYFIDSYQSRILLKDKIITISEYKSRITKTLEELSRSSISNSEFEKTITDMLANHLITDDFAVYYTGLRAKYSKNKTKKS